MRFATAAAFSSAVSSYINRQHRLANRPSQFEEAVASFSKTMPNLKGMSSDSKPIPYGKNLMSKGGIIWKSCGNVRYRRGPCMEFEWRQLKV
jgi:hypothetical protein